MPEEYRDAESVTELLSKQLMPSLVAQVKMDSRGAQDYIPIHVAITQANRIFGHGKWTTEIMKHQPVANANGTILGYSCIARVSIPILDTHYDGYGFQSLTIRRGDIIDDASSHDTAAKGAESDAVKRALRYLGDTFGNSLYEKDNERIPVAKMAITAIAKHDYGDSKDRDALADARKKLMGPYRRLEDVPITHSLSHFYQAISTSANGHQPDDDRREPDRSERRATHEPEPDDRRDDDDDDEADPFA